MNNDILLQELEKKFPRGCVVSEKHQKQATQGEKFVVIGSEITPEGKAYVYALWGDMPMQFYPDEIIRVDVPPTEAENNHKGQIYNPFTNQWVWF